MELVQQVSDAHHNNYFWNVTLYILSDVCSTIMTKLKFLRTEFERITPRINVNTMYYWKYPIGDIKEGILGFDSDRKIRLLFARLEFDWVENP